MTKIEPSPRMEKQKPSTHQYRGEETYFHPNLIPTHKRLPVSFTHGKGVWLYDSEGRAYLDMLAGIAVDSIGHAHPRLVEAIASQAAKVIHVSNNFHIEEQEKLAERVTRLAAMKQAFFVNSGAEANEAAIKLARLYGHQNGVKKPQIVVMEKAFHGRTLATVWAGGNKKVQDGFGPPVDGFIRIPFGDAKALREVVAANSKIVAVLTEVIQGEGGLNVMATPALEEIGAICDQHDLLFMIDEVQTGLGRTGRYFGFQHTQVKPDVITLAKGIGGGVPLGACLIRGRAMNVFCVGSHGSTFGGNPLACAAGNAVLQVIEEQGLCDNAEAVGKFLMSELQGRLARHGVTEVRGRGLMIGAQMNRPCGEITRKALDFGLLLNVTAETVIRFVPPLIITKEEAREAVERLEQVFEA